MKILGLRGSPYQLISYQSLHSSSGFIAQAQKRSALNHLAWYHQGFLSKGLVNTCSVGSSFKESHRCLVVRDKKFMSTEKGSGGMALSFNIEPSCPLPVFEKKFLVPREETQAAAFIKKYPNYDGRNTVVAILDTGVDPGAAGLQVTSDGKPKIIDLVDCTGSGDVIMDKTAVKVSSEEKSPSLKGLSGRVLHLNPGWVNPSGEYRLGLKRMSELYPGPVSKRVQKTNSKLQYNKHAALVENVRAQLAKLPNSEPAKSESDSDNDKGTTKELREELEAQIEVLNDLMAQFKKDDGAVVDVLVFHDGNSHRVAVDWSASGEMSESKALADYVIEREYWPLNYHQPPYELLNISVKVYDEGNLISLVSSAGTHATHVAGILASHHPEDSQLDGVAPGAQIISLKIGESRLGSMETQVGLTRAIAVMAQHKCDLANMSYGEDAKLPNQGRFVKWLQDEIIRRYNCVFVSSAGNSGPALTTCGAPGGTSTDVIGVGAHINHAMMKVEYSVLDYSPEMAYSWSSRAPVSDGDSGVDIYAPGGAITSVPTYILYKSQLMNGTSMASPNLCGCLALLVSGLKQEKASYTTYRILRAIKNTSKPFPERPNQDKASRTGIVQVDRAWEHLRHFESHADLDTCADISILNQKNNRGIYLREHGDTQSPFFATVSLAPRFVNDESSVFGHDLQLRKYELEMYLSMSSTAPFISAPEVVAYNNAGRNFTVKVDPTLLEAGKVHYGEVQAWDSACPAKGPIVQIPVTVIKPIQLETPSYTISHKVSPGSVLRRFITVPAGATYCDMEVIATKPSPSPVRIMAHLVQLLPQERFSHMENKYVLTFDPNANDSLEGAGSQREVRRFTVEGGRTLEICLAQFWANTGDQDFKINFEFHGIHASPSASTNLPLLLDGGATTHRLEVVSSLRREPKASFGISLNRLQKLLTPTKATISPLRTTRDQLPPSNARLYQLVLDYPLKISQMETPATMRLQYPPAMQKFLYDSFLDGFFVTILDAFGQPVGYDEVSPRDQKLPHRGDYTVRLEINHTDPTLLESIKSTMAPNISALFSLSKEIPVSAFAHPHAPYSTSYGSAVSNFVLDKNDVTPIYIKSPVLPANIDAKPGDILLGKLTLSSGPKLSSPPKVGFVLSPKPDFGKDDSSKDETPSDNDRLEDAVIKARLAAVLKAQDKDWKLAKLGEILKAVETTKWDSESQAQLTLLEVVNRQLVSLLDLTGCTSFPEFSQEYQSYLTTLISKTAVDDGKVREYFAHPQPAPKQMSIMKASREASSLTHLTKLILALSETDKYSPEDLDSHYHSMLAHAEFLPSDHEHLHFITQVAYFKEKNWTGRALKALNTYLKSKFPYTTKDRSRLEALLKVQDTLVESLGFSDVWGSYLVNYRLKALPKPDSLVLG